MRKWIQITLKDTSSSINLSNRELKTIPEEVRKHKDVIEIDLSNNQLTDLPLWLKDFTSLKKLNIAHNEFSSLPICISHLNLENLDIRGNTLNEIPRWVLDLPLWSLRIDQSTVFSQLDFLPELRGTTK